MERLYEKISSLVRQVLWFPEEEKRQKSSRPASAAQRRGELSFLPDSPQWFEWLASLSSFRFLGKEGRFTAYRNGTSRHPTRTWCAQRYVHPHKYKQYLGVTDTVTLACLEHVLHANSEKEANRPDNRIGYKKSKRRGRH